MYQKTLEAEANGTGGIPVATPILSAEEESKLRFLKQKGVSPQLYDALQNINHSFPTLNIDIADMMAKGAIPFQLEESQNWTTFATQLQAVSGSVSERKAIREELVRCIAKEEMKLKALTSSLNKHKKQLVELDSTGYQAIPVGPYFSKMVSTTDELVKTEAALSKQIQNCFDEDIALVAKGEEGVPLSLVFNSIGLSQESIEKLSEFNGADFLLASDSDLFLSDFKERKELAYLRHMMITMWNVPYSKHIEECAVCSCENGEDLQALMEEHKKEDNLASLLFASKSPLNGRYFLVLTFEDLSTHFGIQNATKREFSTFRKNIKNYFSAFHNQALRQG